MAKVVPPAEFIGLMISSPGFGFASLTGEAVLRHPHAAQAKSRTQRSSAHTSLRNPSLAIWGVAVTVGSGFLQWGWFKISKVQIWSASFFFFLFSAGSNIPTSFPWKISLRANHTATLSCNCEYRSCGFSLIFSPLRGTHCVSHAANDARHVHMTNGCTRANAEPCPRVSSGGVLLYTCSLSSPHPPQPETSCQRDQERHWLLRLCICHRSVDNQGDKWCWGREIKTLWIFVWHKAWKKNSCFWFSFCVRVCARECSNPNSGLGSTQTKEKFYVDKCLPLVVDEENNASQLKWTLKTHFSQHEHAGRPSRTLFKLCSSISHSRKLFLFV